MAYPTRKEEKELVRRARAGDGEARETLIMANMNFIRFVAKKFSNRGQPMEDIEQVGIQGFIESLNVYDPDRDNRVKTLASWWIRGRILDHLARRNIVVGPRKGYAPNDPRARMVSIDAMDTSQFTGYNETEESPVQEAIRADEKEIVHGAMKKLRARDRRIVKMRFGFGKNKAPMSLSEIGQKLGISSERVRQIVKRSLIQLRGALPHELS